MIVEDKKYDVAGAIKIHLPLILFSIGYWVLGFILIQVFRVDEKPMFYTSIFYLLGFVIFSAIFVIPIYLAYVCLIVRPVSPFGYIYSNFLETRVFTRMVHLAVALMALLIFISATLEMKSIIPFANPFCFDPIFMKIDAVIHGHPPWMYLEGVINSPVVIGIIDIFYSLWFFIL